MIGIGDKSERNSVCLTPWTIISIVFVFANCIRATYEKSTSYSQSYNHFHLPIYNEYITKPISNNIEENQYNNYNAHEDNTNNYWNYEMESLDGYDHGHSNYKSHENAYRDQQPEHAPQVYEPSRETEDEPETQLKTNTEMFRLSQSPSLFPSPFAHLYFNQMPSFPIVIYVMDSNLQQKIKPQLPPPPPQPLHSFLPIVNLQSAPKLKSKLKTKFKVSTKPKFKVIKGTKAPVPSPAAKTPISSQSFPSSLKLGRPGIDFPTLSTIPKTKFHCKTQRFKGFFGDPETNCQVWHYCDLNGGQASFLCPNGTIFNQQALTCDWWYNTECSSTVQQYVINERLYKFILPFKKTFPEDYSGPVVDKYLTSKFQELEVQQQQQQQQQHQQTENNNLTSIIAIEATTTATLTINDDNFDDNELLI